MSSGAGLSRRRFLVLTGTAAAGATLAACAPAASPGGASSTPKTGGTVMWAQAADNSIIDPALTSGAAGTEIFGNILDSLVQIDDDFKLRPWLATKWTVENNSTKFTFTLRDDVKFHDGTPMTSEAVKGSFERIADPRTKAAAVFPALGPLDRIETPDPRTAILYFKSPNTRLLYQLWRPWFGLLSPKQLAATPPGEIITAPVGSGPFKFVSKSSDGVYTLAKNPDYKWPSDFMKNKGPAYIDTLKFRRVSDAGTRMATLESGESQLVDNVAETDAARLQKDPKLTLVRIPRQGPGYGFQFNMKKFPTSELAVRQAFNWAVDRQGIVDKVLSGVDYPTVGPLTQGMWGRLDELEKTIPYGGDKKKAADFLEAAGWKVGAGGVREKNGQKLSLVLAAVAGSFPQNDLADALQLQVREIGIDLQVQKMAINNWLSFTRAYMHDLCDSTGADFDPDILRLRFHSQFIGTTNYANLSDPQLDDLFVKGQNAPFGTDERKQIYASVQRRMMELLPMLSMITVVFTAGMTSKLHGYKFGVSGLNALPLTDIWLDS